MKVLKSNLVKVFVVVFVWILSVNYTYATEATADPVTTGTQCPCIVWGSCYCIVMNPNGTGGTYAPWGAAGSSYGQDPSGQSCTITGTGDGTVQCSCTARKKKC